MKNFKVNRLQQLIIAVLINLGLNLHANAMQDTANNPEQEHFQEEFTEQENFQQEFAEGEEYSQQNFDEEENFQQEFTEEQLEEMVDDSESIEGEISEGDIPATVDPETEPQDDQAAIESAEAKARVMAIPVEAYQRCTKAVIASDSPIGGKREELDTRCQSQRDQIVQVLPKELSEFMLLNMDRRLDMVIEVMEETEALIDDTAEDMEDAVDALSTNDSSAADQME